MIQKSDIIINKQIIQKSNTIYGQMIQKSDIITSLTTTLLRK